jgi:hypothetical protein
MTVEFSGVLMRVTKESTYTASLTVRFPYHYSHRPQQAAGMPMTTLLKVARRSLTMRDIPASPTTAVIEPNDGGLQHYQRKVIVPILAVVIPILVLAIVGSLSYYTWSRYCRNRHQRRDTERVWISSVNQGSWRSEEDKRHSREKILKQQNKNRQPGIPMRPMPPIPEESSITTQERDASIILTRWVSKPASTTTDPALTTPSEPTSSIKVSEPAVTRAGRSTETHEVVDNLHERGSNLDAEKQVRWAEKRREMEAKVAQAFEDDKANHRALDAGLREGGSETAGFQWISGATSTTSTGSKEKGRGIRKTAKEISKTVVKAPGKMLSRRESKKKARTLNADDEVAESSMAWKGNSPYEGQYQV